MAEDKVTSEIENKMDEIHKSLIEANVDVNKFVHKGNDTARVRARVTLQKVKKMVQEARVLLGKKDED